MSFYDITSNVLIYNAIFAMIASVFIVLLYKFKGAKIKNSLYKMVALAFILFMILTFFYLFMMGFLYIISNLFLF